MKKHGFEVVFASDGRSGVQRAVSDRPDLILLDVLMPGMDGFETCRQLKTTEIIKDIPVIFMTALSGTAEKAHRQEDLRVELVEADIQMSEKSLQKIIDELLDNALKFSEPGTLVQIRTEVNHRHWFLRISDQGRGMMDEQIANVRAFMQFERKHYEQQGSGLGLTIARLLAQLNGGELIIESVPQHGTTVTVRFNRKKA
jgi:signal transduction histidine kinase